ncbi:MAG TPA: DUF4031 domain-containing protein [Beutenbergiaceae bacterium]|nr:DUF4031 domain-containing protein [Beutenbergiaceae bacterium]
MAILIDPPLWPAHGTIFAHLVSDESLSELHDFAARAGLHERAFDGDHYDVPAERYDDLVALGAQPVSGRELIRRLRASGLRIPARDRREMLRRTLTAAWRTLPITGDPDVAPSAGVGAGASPAAAAAPAAGATPAAGASPATGASAAAGAETTADSGLTALGAELLDRWDEPHRRYHDMRHLRDVLAALDRLCRPEPPPLPVTLAAWFHDAVYNGEPDVDEEASAELARLALGRLLASGRGTTAPGTTPASHNGPATALTQDTIDEVARLVLLTRSHSPESGDHHGELLCDADLAVLGRDPAGYRRYTADVRAEYAHVPEPDFAKGRTAVVRRLLELQPLYRTARGRELWQEQARSNLHAELAALTHT